MSNHESGGWTLEAPALEGAAASMSSEDDGKPAGRRGVPPDAPLDFALPLHLPRRGTDRQRWEARCSSRCATRSGPATSPSTSACGPVRKRRKSHRPLRASRPVDVRHVVDYVADRRPAVLVIDTAVALRRRPARTRTGSRRSGSLISMLRSTGVGRGDRLRTGFRKAAVNRRKNRAGRGHEPRLQGTDQIRVESRGGA